MKFYLSLIAALTLSAATFISPTVAVETAIIAQEIEPELKAYGRSISVKIDSSNNGGSGVIIGKKEANQYLVITNHHVVRGGENFTIQTNDGITHQGTLVSNPITSDDDIALLTFLSNNNYQVANLNSAARGKKEQTVLAVGYSAETGELMIEEGNIKRIPNQPFKEGYQIGYTNNIVSGMSGGAILNIFGDVIGINGISAFPILDAGYEYQDGTQPSAAQIEQYRQLSWGLSLHRLLTQLNPEIIIAYSLPLPETTAKIENTQLAGWLGELEATAKQISVRIDSSSGANGSGIIIAQEGNTYAVLTAAHVVCQRDNATQPCANKTYKILAPDGNSYPVEPRNIKRQEGVDLAVVRFTSNEQYQIAQLANYPVTNDDVVFVAGYPKLSNNTPAQWLFSLGFGLEREQGLLSVNDDSLTTDSSGLVSSQRSLSGGYEMVYTSITYGGMSGGAVLDREGRVIGIHGLAEGETAFDSQNNTSKQVQLGYSLGIPINTFIGLADRFEINASLPIQDNRPRELNSAEQKTFASAILDAEISQGNATAEIWLERGNQLWRLNRYDDAVEAFEQVMALEAEFIHLAYYGKGLALLYEQEYQAALASLELATKTQPNFAPAFLHKSEVLRRLNRLDEALVAIERAISLQKNQTNFYNQKGLILYDLKRYSEAEVAFSQAIKINSLSSFYNNRGIIYYTQGKLELALADYNRALELNPESASAYGNRGNLYSEQGKLELALADYNRVLEINPESAYAYNNRGTIYYTQGKLELALADYNRVLEINPKDSKGYNNRGNLYSEQGKLELALADFNRALEINPESVDVYYNRGLVYKKQGKLKLVLADLNRALELNPQFAEAHYNRGLIHKELKNIEEARFNLQKAQQLFIAQGNHTHAEKTANLLSELQQQNSTVSVSNPNSSINNDDAKTYYNRGISYGNQKKWDLAINQYNQAISINSEYSEAYYNRSLIYQNQGKTDLAIADLNRAIEIDANYAKAYHALGWVYMQTKNTDQAKLNLEKAQELYISQGDRASEAQVAKLLSKID